nr:AMP-binding protein [Deinobacterium chartae]
MIEAARAHPERAAILEGRRVTRYRDLERNSARLALALRDRGLTCGDRVLLLLPLSARLYVTLAALWRLGAVPVVLDVSLGRAHLEASLRRARPRALIGSPKAHLLQLVSPALRAVPLRIIAGRMPLPRGSDGPLEELPPEHPALITLTSGSTGRPKAAARSHGLLAAQYAALREAMGLGGGDLDLSTLPIVALAQLASGNTCVLPDADLRRPGRVDGARLLRQLARHPARSVAASPALLERLVGAAERACARLPFERVFAGGGPVFPTLLERLARVAPDAHIVAVYGSTEAEPIAHVAWQHTSGADLERTRSGGGLLAGRPVPQIRLSVLPDRFGQPLPYAAQAELEAAALGPYAPGEIVVSGAHVLPGYLDGEGDLETKWRDPVSGTVWHRTGDAGYLDDAGRLWLLGRCSARVTDARGTLYPFAVEAAAQALPGVRRAALVAQEGGRVLCLETGDPALDLVEVRAALDWARLDRVRRVRALPLDARHTAKIDYPRLARMLGKT